MKKAKRKDKWQLQRQFARIVRKELRQMDCTERRLAACVGVSNSRLCAILKCKEEVSFDTVSRITWSLGIKATLCVKRCPRLVKGKAKR